MEKTDNTVTNTENTNKPESDHAVALSSLLGYAFKQGDWCFCEFELQQIKEIAEDGRITDVSNGYVSHGGWELNDRIFPLDMRTKLISEHFKSEMDDLHKLRCNGLNFPDIHRYFVSKWVETCLQKDNNKMVELRCKEISSFASEIKESVKEASLLSINGVPLYRR